MSDNANTVTGITKLIIPSTQCYRLIIPYRYRSSSLPSNHNENNNRIRISINARNRRVLTPPPSTSTSTSPSSATSLLSLISDTNTNINTNNMAICSQSSQPIPQSMPQSMPLTVNQSQSQQLSYVEALKLHQTSRLAHIREETAKLQQFLQRLRSEVFALESSQTITPENAIWAQKLSKIREENRSLRIECHCLSMEVDLYASGQMPLGITDENFYQNIPEGPYGSLLQQNQATVQNRRAVEAQPPSYEESIAPPPRLSFGNASDILGLVPPAPRPVWLSPAVQQSPTSPLTPPILPPRPSSISPRPPVLQQLPNQNGEEGVDWVCEKCTVKNHPALAYCEICEMPRNGYLGANCA